MNTHYLSYPETSRVCLHYLSGRTDAAKPCLLNYECFHCAYDQWLDLMDLEIRAEPTPAEKSSCCP